MERYIQNLDEHTAINLSKELNEINIKSEGKCIFNFSDNISCSPFGMLLIENTIKNIRQDNLDTIFTARVNKEAESIKYAGHMGFFKSISEDINIGKLPGEAMGNSNYIPITKIDFVNYRKNSFFAYMEPLRYIEYESRNLAKVLAQNNKELEELFTYLIRETIRNSQEHGKVNLAWVCAQNWKNRNMAEIAILDNGIGYKNSLDKRYGSKIDNDETAIRYALKPGITESYTNKFVQEDENSGFGLYVASEVCDALNGSFSILSGQTMLRKGNGSTSIIQGYHKGSAIKMSIDTSKKFKYSNLISEIVNKGEQEIKNLEKASELSRGKFIIK